MMMSTKWPVGRFGDGRVVPREDRRRRRWWAYLIADSPPNVSKEYLQARLVLLLGTQLRHNRKLSALAAYPIASSS
eukprot:316437-Hanusia_phi.AAC.1